MKSILLKSYKEFSENISVYAVKKTFNMQCTITNTKYQKICLMKVKDKVSTAHTNTIYDICEYITFKYISCERKGCELFGI